MKRLGIISLVAGLALLLTTTPVRANGEDEADYLATGDSVAFGFNPLLDRRDADNFVGYPEALAEMLGIDVVNSACPGEASGGFISLTGVDQACRPYRAQFPLHVRYATSQLDFAVSFLRSHQTRLVTIDMGAVDLFLLRDSCPPPPDQAGCVLQGLPAMLATLGHNLGVIYAAMRGAGFRGQLVALTYYVDDYREPIRVAAFQAVNAVVAQVTALAGGQVADGFGAFKAIADAEAGGDTCAAGLINRLTPTRCDIHPSPRGRNVLARALKAVVNLPDHET